MKKKYLVFLIICSFCFFYTEKIALKIKDKNPIMKNINKVSKSKFVDSIDSTLVEDLYIIPGLNGKEINKNKSFNNMKNTNNYNDELLVFDQIQPDISLENNKNRIIIRGNENKNNVSIIFEEKNSNSEYMLQKNYHVNILINKEEYDLNYEMINNAKVAKTYNNIDKYLEKNNLLNNLCYVKDKISKLCKNKYLFKPSMIITQSSLVANKNKVSAGEIILIKGNISLNDLEILIRQIEYKDLKIVCLSELISEIN